MKAERRRWKRWSLFALLAAILVALGIAYAALARARERAMRARCKGNLRSLVYFLHVYSGDYGEAFPPTLGHLYPDYISDGKVFLCPSAGRATALEDNPQFSPENYTPAMLGDTHPDYVYVSGLRADDPADYILAFDDEWNHDGAGLEVLYIGLNVEWEIDFKAVHEQLAGQEKEFAAQGRKMKLLRPAWSTWPEPPPELTGRPLRSGHRIAVVVGAFAAVAVALALIVRTVRRGRKPGLLS